MQLQGHTEVMVPISLVVLNNRGFQNCTGTVQSHQTKPWPTENRRAHAQWRVSDLVRDENTVLFSCFLPPVFSNTTGLVPLQGRFLRATFGSTWSAEKKIPAKTLLLIGDCFLKPEHYEFRLCSQPLL